MGGRQSGGGVVARKTDLRRSPSTPASRDAIPAYRRLGPDSGSGWESVGDGRFLLMGGRHSGRTVVARKANRRKSPSTPASRDAIPAYRRWGPDSGVGWENAGDGRRFVMDGQTLYGVATIPLIVGLIQVAKYTGLPTRLAPVLALVLGVAAGILSVCSTTAAHSAMNWPCGVVLGLSFGLAAAGFYEIGKTQVQTYQDRGTIAAPHKQIGAP